MVKGKVQQKPATKKVAASSLKATPVSSPDAAGGKDSCKSKSAYKADIPGCGGCGKYITDEVKAIQCDRCQKNEGWKCIDCLNLSPIVYEALTSDTNSNFRWFCEECDELVMGTVSKNLIDDLMSQIARLTSKVENLEAKVGDVSLFDDLHNRLEDKMVQIAVSIDNKLESLVNREKGGSVGDVSVFEAWQSRLEDKVAQMSVSIDDKLEALTNSERGASVVDSNVQHVTPEDLAEMDEIRKRSCSVIIHGLEEPTDLGDDSVEDQECGQVINLLHAIKCDKVSVGSFSRLGRRQEGTDAKPRPAKMTLVSEGQKEEVLRQAKNLKGKKDKGFDRVFIHQDLTPKQRQKRKLLVQELKERQSQGERNLMILGDKIVERRMHYDDGIVHIKPPQTIMSAAAASMAVGTADIGRVST